MGRLILLLWFRLGGGVAGVWHGLFRLLAQLGWVDLQGNLYVLGESWIIALADLLFVLDSFADKIPRSTFSGMPSIPLCAYRAVPCWRSPPQATDLRFVERKSAKARWQKNAFVC